MAGFRVSEITRRRFLTTTATAATALASPIILRPRAAMAEGKTLRIAAGEADSSTGTLDPAFSAIDPDAARMSLVYERLVYLDENFAPVAQLAESWSSNDKGDSWDFKLRQGVKFHDGADFAAEDVVFSFKRLMDKSLGSPGTASFTAIGAVEAADAHTVRFRLNQPVVEFPGYISNRFAYVVRKGQTNDDLRTKGVGTGAFKVKHFVPGEEPSVFVKNETYRLPGLPKVDAIELRAIPEEAARIAAISTGQIDLVWDLPRIGLDALEANKDVNVVSIRSPFVMTLSCWADKPPFDDVRVRTALKLVIDREKMLKVVLGKHGQLGNDNPVAPWVKYAIDEPIRKRDIEKAKALLAQAGHADGLAVDLVTSDTVPGFVEMATVFKAMAGDAGINVNLIQAPANDYWDVVWLKQPFICSSWSGRPADEALSVAYLSKAEWNETHWKRPEFDQLIADARSTVDEAKRAELYQKAQRLLRDDGGAIIPMHPDAVGATRSNIKGWKLHPQLFTKDFSQVEITG